MIKKKVISVISEEENRKSIEFQVFHFTNKIRRLNFTFGISQKRLFIAAGSTKNLKKTTTAVVLFVK